MSGKGRQRPKKILAIDWDARTLRVVHALLGRRGVKIDRLLSIGIPADVDPANPSQMGRHIRRSLDQEGIDVKHATVDIPRDQAILNTLTLPALMPEELPGMVQIQIAKELPYPVHDAVIDFAVSPTSGDSPTAEVLVAAVRREVLAQYEATCAAADLKLDRVGLRPYASKLAVCELLKHAMPERVVVMDLGPALTEISVLRNGSLIFSRAASVLIPKNLGESPRLSVVPQDGSYDISEPAPSAGLAPSPPNQAEVIQSLLVELTRSIEAYRARDAAAQIDHVVIGGDLGLEEMLAETIQHRLSIPTEIYNPASSFGWEPDEGAGASAFAATLGLVLASAIDDRLHFDFLHPKRSGAAAQQRLKRAPLVAAVALLFIVAAGVAAAQITKPARERLSNLEKRISELKENESDNRKFLELVEGKDGIRDFDRQLVWVDELQDALSALPSNEEMILKQVDMNQKEDRLVFKTESKRRETPQEVIGRLEAFRREGKDKPRFKVGMGPQSEKTREKYPYSQDVKIQILDDETAARVTTP